MWGWEPTERTEHEYDMDGRLVATTTTRSAEFDQEQRDMLMALRLYTRELDPNGIPFSEATSPQADPNNFDFPEVVRFIAHGPFTNWAQKAKLDAEKAFIAGHPESSPPNMNGKFFTVEKKTFPNKPAP